MKRVTRRLKRHFGSTAKRVAVKSQRPWYWAWLFAGLLMLAGYLIGYWQFTGGDYSDLHSKVEHLTKENQSLQAKMVYSERQLQVEQATQSNLSKELTKLQDEDMKLKEDLAFYKNMLGERARRGR
jgi:predicted nuclease with TOPRIM domain